MRIHGHLRGVNNEAAIVRSSLGLLYLFAAVPINPSTNSVRLSIICERNRSGCAAKPRRTAYDLHRHFEPTQGKTDVSACAWIAVDTKTVLEWRNQIRRASPCSVSGARIEISDGVYRLSDSSLITAVAPHAFCQRPPGPFPGTSYQRSCSQQGWCLRPGDNSVLKHSGLPRPVSPGEGPLPWPPRKAWPALGPTL